MIPPTWSWNLLSSSSSAREAGLSRFMPRYFCQRSGSVPAIISFSFLKTHVFLGWSEVGLWLDRTQTNNLKQRDPFVAGVFFNTLPKNKQTYHLKNGDWKTGFPFWKACFQVRNVSFREGKCINKNWSVSECLSPWNVGSIFFWSGPSLDRVFVKANERSAGRWDDQWNTAYGFWVSLYNHSCTLILLRWVDKKPSNRIPQIVIYWWFTNCRSKTSPPQIQVCRLYSNQPCLVSSPPPSPTFRLQLFQGHVLPEDMAVSDINGGKKPLEEAFVGGFNPVEQVATLIMSQDSPGIGIRNIFQKNLLYTCTIYMSYIAHS